MIERVINHIVRTARVPSFSSYEERLHPYIRSVFDKLSQPKEIDVEGNNLIFRIGQSENKPIIALAAHMDKINHYGAHFPEKLPVTTKETYIEGAMDDCAGLGIVLSIAEWSINNECPDLLFFFSEMEESKGLKEHPELLKKEGKDYNSGMGAYCIAKRCIKLNLLPDIIIVVDTTPLFKGTPGIALYTNHWELNGQSPSEELVKQTKKMRDELLDLNPGIKIANNTNDYLQYGKYFNTERKEPVVSIALEPAIYPYHQKGERVFTDDVKQVLDLLIAFLG